MAVNKTIYYLFLSWIIMQYNQVYTCTINTVQHANNGGSVVLQFKALIVNPENDALFAINVIRSPNGRALFTILYTNGATTQNPTCDGCTFVGNILTGDISIRLDNLQAVNGGTYKLQSGSEVIKCVIVHVLGEPETPTITDNNSNSEGEDIVLECNSKSTTVPTDSNLGLHYMWKVNNVLNPVDPRYTYTQNKLTISDLVKEDGSKQFICAASESGPGVIGLSSLWSGTFMFALIYGPGVSTTKLSPGDSSYTREENSYLGNITCTADCYPACNYEWTKRGNIVVSSNRVLSLETLKRIEAGTYTCTVTNPQKSGTVTKVVTVSVTYGPDINSLNLSPPITTYSVNEGTNPPDITCSTDCYPKCTYKWSKTGTSNVISSTGTLHLGSLYRNESAEYTCTATNPRKGGTVTKQVTVNVRYGPDKCNISVQSPYALAEGNTSTEITCQSDCYPSCSYKWINSSTGKVVGSEGMFQLDKVTRYEAGNYTCICENTAIVNSSKATLLQVIVNSASLFIEGHKGKKDVTVDEYDIDIQFNCEIDSYQESRIQILFKDVILKEAHQPTVLTFTRSSIMCSHAGVYTCKGSSQHAQAPSSNINLFVRCSPRPLQQIKQNKTSSLYVPTSLTFTTIAYPEPGPTGIFWHKENGVLWMPLLSNNDLLVSSSGLQSNLTILNVSQSDYGRYKVTATNDIGSYVQYLFLEREDIQKETYTTESCEVESNKTGTIVGICFGALSAGLAVYASYLTVLHKRRSTRKGKQTTEDLNTQVTYINIAEEGTVRHINDSSGNKDDSAKLYTELAQYSKDEKSTYDVIQKN